MFWFNIQSLLVQLNMKVEIVSVVLISDCEELVGVAQRSECHFLKLNGTLEAQFDFV